jgi:hypothetical protein
MRSFSTRLEGTQSPLSSAQVPEQLPLPSTLTDYGLLAIALFALIKNLIH